MKNRFSGECGLCGIKVASGQGRWRLIPKKTQNFEGLRCRKCSTTTKRGLKSLKEKGLIINR